jgi:hypothetical protein
MAPSKAGPASRASRPFGRVEGLRALTAVMFAVVVGLVTLPTALAGFWRESHAVLLLAAGIAALVGFALAARSTEAARQIALGNWTSGARVPWALLTMACGAFVVAVIPLRTLVTAGWTSTGSAGEVLSGLLLSAAGVAVFLIGFGALRGRRPYGHERSPAGVHPTGTGAPPHTLGRLHEVAYGAPEALLAAAVVVFLAMMGYLMLPDSLWRGEYREVASRALVTTDGSYRAPMGRAYGVTALLLIQVALLVAVWRTRRPRFAAEPAEVDGMPAAVTLVLGLATLLMIPAWMSLAAGGDHTSRGTTFLLGSMAITGFALVALAISRMPRARGARTSAAHLESRPHTHGGLATPESAFQALRERQPGFSFSGIRRLVPLPEPRPVGFSLTRVPDRSLAPSAMGVGLLGLLSVLVGLPAVALVVRSLIS